MPEKKINLDILQKQFLQDLKMQGQKFAGLILKAAFFSDLTDILLIKLTGKRNSMADKPLVGIIMGSDSDLPVMEKSFEVLKEFGISYEVKILSAHRTPEQHAEYARSADSRGLKVIIAAAGGAAHLPGVTAANTVLPVIGVPIYSKSLNGMDSLLSIVQMPSGIPVATVAVDGAKNAAILAVQIIAAGDDKLKTRFYDYKKKIEEESVRKNENLKIS